jgi:hypothetical protein
MSANTATPESKSTDDCYERVSEAGEPLDTFTGYATRKRMDSLMDAKGPRPKNAIFQWMRIWKGFAVSKESEGVGGLHDMLDVSLAGGTQKLRTRAISQTCWALSK